ncbi:hypothetical protein GCM10009839_10140 [Catenulispora yoronensis]|uniref:Uncharacterized protein n=1 Tax=Catenulispora yoronensis TaxID=450799 RepID=A0ABP5F828_9ACTN
MLGPASGYLLTAAAVLTVAAYLYRILTRRDRGTPEKAMSIVIGELDGLFSPGSIHWQQEKQRIAMMRDNPESGDPPFGPIDLVSGKVVIRQPTEEPAAE